MEASRQELAERLESLRDEMARLGRADARLIAVTKGFPASTVAMARDLGIDDFGENYAQDLLEKVDSLGGATTHFIGRIQRNKVRKIAGHVDLWHSVDRIEILVEIARRRPGASVLIQVNPSADPTKAGVSAAELPSMLEVADREALSVVGLMTIGVHDDPEATHEAFVEVDRLATEFGLAERSMGMSGDYRDALSCGSTMIRIGTALFGPRP